MTENLKDVRPIYVVFEKDQDGELQEELMTAFTSLARAREYALELAADYGMIVVNPADAARGFWSVRNDEGWICITACPLHDERHIDHLQPAEQAR